MKRLRAAVKNLLPNNRALAALNLRFFLLGLTRIPLLAFVGPRFVELSADRVVLKIRLGYRTKNHVGSMYFGALAIGADAAVGGFTWYLIQQKRAPVTLIFRDFKADYVKRAEGDVLFVCEEGAMIAHLIDRACTSEERVHETITAVALAPDKFGEEPVARFALTLSLRATR